jgi:anti-sigma factor RsiW
MTDPGLRCIEVVELVSDYLDDELDEETRRRVEEHLTLCPACRIYVEQVRETVQALGELPSGALPARAVAELEAAFREFPRNRP